MAPRPKWQQAIDKLIPDIDPDELGIREEIKDLEEVFYKLSSPPIMVNDFDISLASERERLNDLIFTKHEGDTLSNLPRCSCGATTSRKKVGKIASCCGTVVAPLSEKSIDSLLWLHVPEGIPAFINPQVWRILAKSMTHSGFNLLEYLINPYYKANVKAINKIRELDELNLPKGLCNFYYRFDEIVKVLYANKFLMSTARAANELMEFLDVYRDRIFTKVLPFPSKLLFIEERNLRSRTIDPQMLPAQEAINVLGRLYAGKKLAGEDFVEPDIAIKEARCTKVFVYLDKFYTGFESQIIFRKPGVMRKLIGGCLPHGTGRAVINSLHEPHRYDQIQTPWSMSVLLLMTHLRNKLLKRDFTPNEMRSLIYENTLKHHLLLRSLFDELLEEAPGGAIPALFLRNPSLRRGSIQYLPIGAIKDDPTVNSISFSILATTAPNADVDGDEMTVFLPLDNETAEVAKRMAPHLGVMDLNKPYRVSRNVKLPAPFIATLAHYIDYHDEHSEFYNEDGVPDKGTIDYGKNALNL